MPLPATVTWQSSVGPTAMSVNGPDERMCTGCCAAAGTAATSASTEAQATARRSEQNISTIPPRNASVLSRGRRRRLDALTRMARAPSASDAIVAGVPQDAHPPSACLQRGAEPLTEGAPMLRAYRGLWQGACFGTVR